MLALAFHLSIPRIALTRALAMVSGDAVVGWTSPLRLEEVPDPPRRGEDWLLLRTRICGICGSDAKQVFLRGNLDNPMTALTSFPHVLGHEIVGEVVAAGSRSGRRAGERVVVDPWLSCAPRGIEPVCSACAAGQHMLCRSFRSGALPPSIHLGNCRGAGGGFAPMVAVHATQALPIPDGISWDQAVLSDPAGVALHAVYANPPAATALVYGCGTLGLLTIATLRHRFPHTRVLAVARHPHQRALAARLGAHRVLDGSHRAALIDSVVAECGGRVLRPWRGLPWSLDGVSVVYDTVGAASTLEAGLRMAAARARIVMVGVEAPRRVEWTPLYFKELALVGSNAYGVETDPTTGVRRHAMEHYFAMAAEGMDVTAIISHRFALHDHAAAFRACRDQRASGAVKVVFDLASG